MKILAIRGCNIASLEGDFEIDFTKEPLCSNGIYAITGPTGAGKSTILDVLCVALYNKTPRLLRASGKDIRDVGNEMLRDKSTQNLLRKGCGSGYAEVDFVAMTGKSYRANWSIRRAGNNPRKRLQNPAIKLFDLTDLSDLSDTNSATLDRIQQLVGLTYDQFSRAVLLAQGEFSAFLKAADGERAELLEKLTGTDIYSRISSSVYERWDHSKKELEGVELQLRNQQLLTAEEVEKLAALQKEKEAELGGIDQEIKRLENVLNWFKRETELKKQVEDAQQKIADANQRKVEMAPTYAFLEKIEAIKEIEKSFTLLMNKSEQAEKEAKNYTALLEKLQKCALRKNELQEGLEKAANDKNVFLEKEPQFRQELRNARELDVELKGVQQELTGLQKEYDQAVKQWQEEEKKVDEIQKNLKNTTEEIDSTAKWLTSNSTFQNIADNLGVITKSLSLLTDYRKEYVELVKEENRLIGQNEKAQEDLKTLSEFLLSKEKEVADEKGNEDTIRKQMAEVNPDQLKDRQRLLDEQAVSLNDLSLAWGSLSPLLEGVAKNKSEILENQKRIVEIESELLKATPRLKDIKAGLLQVDKIEAEYRLRVSENVEAMRAALVQGNPCPVCGSTEHLYDATQSSAFKMALETITEQRTRLEGERSQLEQQIAKYENSQQELTKLTQKLREENEGNEKKIAIYQKEWAENREAKNFESVESAHRASEIKKRRDSIVSERNECLRQLSVHDDLVKRLDKSAQRMQQLNKSLNDKRNEHTRLNTASEGFVTALGEQKKRSEAKLAQLEEEKLKLDLYFTSPEWWPDWKANASGFVDALNEKAKTFKEQQQKLETAQTRKTVLTSTLGTAQSTVKNAEAQVKERRVKTREKEDLQKEKMRARSSYFEGANADVAEEGFEKQKLHLQQEVERCTRDISEVSEELTKGNGEKTQMETTAQRLENERSLLAREVEEWLSHYNESQDAEMGMEELRGLFATPLVRIDAARESRREIENLILTLTSTLNTHQDNLRDHQTLREGDPFTQEGEIPTKETAEDALNERKRARVDVEKDYNTYTFQLRDQEKRAKDAVELKKKQEEARNIFTKWSQLNEAVGQRDGAKFRMFAQGYTLDVLLQNANLHIRTIAPRYSLQRIPESLSLQVIDRDMCDNVRSVHSLSGGETFLVSLALALGLSSLSSRQMNIESLFIDEGFGSLDQETLSAAMDALESLRLQGRKVGVITHVREMTERISARVMVSKKNNGASKIEVA